MAGTIQGKKPHKTAKKSKFKNFLKGNTKMKNTEKSIIFSACHELTKAITADISADYRATFTACLKLYYSDKAGFYRACKITKTDVSALAQADNDSFDIFKAFSDNDSAKIENLINFAFSYGLKKNDAYRTKTEVLNDTISDNFYPKAIDSLCANDIEDVKHNIVIYLLSRADNIEFMKKPNVFKLISAGVICVHSYIEKFGTVCKNTAFSIDAVSEEIDSDKNMFYADKREQYADIDKCDIFEYICDNLPKAHRQLARKFLHRYYSNKGKSGYTIAQIAEQLDVSVRTLKSILSEVRDIGLETIQNRDK